MKLDEAYIAQNQLENRVVVAFSVSHLTSTKKKHDFHREFKHEFKKHVIKIQY